jgi:hypothetical protein
VPIARPVCAVSSVIERSCASAKMSRAVHLPGAVTSTLSRSPEATAPSDRLSESARGPPSHRHGGTVSRSRPSWEGGDPSDAESKHRESIRRPLQAAIRRTKP